MLRPSQKNFCKAQTAVEYLVLLGVMVTVALVGFKTFLEKTNEEAGNVFNASAIGIMGEASISNVVDPGRSNYP